MNEVNMNEEEKQKLVEHILEESVTNLDLANWITKVTSGDNRPGFRLAAERLAECTCREVESNVGVQGISDSE